MGLRTSKLLSCLRHLKGQLKTVPEALALVCLLINLAFNGWWTLPQNITGKTN